MFNDTTRTLKPGTMLARRLRVERVLGVGGMAIVYLVFHIHLQTQYACKVLNPEMSRHAKVRKRLLRESDVMEAMDHPHIVKVFGVEVDEERDLLLIKMEYMAGGSLLDQLESQGPLSCYDACQLMLKLLSALAYTHEKGVVHRDIKPGNILLATDGTPKFSDFGIAQAAENATALTRMGEDAMLGTHWYMPPEQNKLIKRVDGRADIFALGVTLHQLLSGLMDVPERLLFYDQVQKEPEIMDTILPQLRPIIMKATAIDPNDRYQSANEMAQAISAIIPHLPTAEEEVEAKRPTGGTMVPDVDGEGVVGTQFHFESSSQVVSADGLVHSTPEPTPRAVVVPQPKGQKTWGGGGGTIANAHEINPPKPQRLPHKKIGIAVALLIFTVVSGFRLYRTSQTLSEQHSAAARSPRAEQPEAGTFLVPPETTDGTKGPALATSHELVEGPNLPVTVSSVKKQAVKQPSVAKARPEIAPAVVPVEAITESPKTRVTFSGADRVRLEGDAGSFTLPASVPSGTYKVFARFGDGQEQKVIPQIKVTDTPVAITCDVDFLGCTRQ